MKNNILLKLSKKAYEDSVYGCWIGKNIGGTIGTPYERCRDELDIKGFSTKPGEPLPNDDLDLQLVWLYLLEKIGSRALNARELGKSWLHLIPPNWNEYGIGKVNMRKGLVPPMSGDYDNDWKHSNGAWIRTEIWATLAPACPDIAAKYALEDASVDHGNGEGTMAAIFVAAMQSAAFAVKDVRKCIEIGLSEIPETSRVYDSVKEVIACYDKGMTRSETRNYIQKRNSDIGTGWFEAPSNVAYAIIGLIYGEGDFKNSILYAVNCGDDTDCTAATVGATLGILYGGSKIPEDWKAYIGDEIITMSVRVDGPGHSMAKSCTELTKRVIAQAPFFLFDNDAYTEIVDEDVALPENVENIVGGYCRFINKSKELKPLTVSYDTPEFTAWVTVDESLDVAPEEVKKVILKVKLNTEVFGEYCLNLNLRWWLADGFEFATPPKKSVRLRNRDYHVDGTVTVEFLLKAGQNVMPTNKCVLELSVEEGMTNLYIPVSFIG